MPANHANFQESIFRWTKLADPKDRCNRKHSAPTEPIIEAAYSIGYHAHRNEHDQQISVYGRLGKPAVFLEFTDLTEPKSHKTEIRRNTASHSRNIESCERVWSMRITTIVRARLIFPRSYANLAINTKLLLHGRQSFRHDHMLGKCEASSNLFGC